ncbi:MAG: recombinase family protein [Janthinobacterium lividum]
MPREYSKKAPSDLGGNSDRVVRRCAIYTRKSSYEKADAQFTSLQNQREYCAAFIAAQAGEGWVESPDTFDDGGFSGGSLVRPSLTRLRAAIAAGSIDTVIVYKIDRLSRSLRDFANLVAEFEARGVTFVSVTQAFDTGSSMGRLTLNVLLSFAQFERELTGERLRDWFAGARARGLWVPDRPYGYAKADGNNLVPHPEEAHIVRRIFQRYAKLGSCRLVADELFADSVMNKAGRPWNASMVLHTIKHRVYRGEIVHRRKSLPGHHEPIVSERLWQRAQKTYLDSKWRRRATQSSPVVAALKGLVFDRTGSRLHHTFLHSKGRLYRYYIASAERRRYGTGSDAFMRFRAADLEGSVLDIVQRLAGYAPRNRQRWEDVDMLRRHVERVDIGLDDMCVRFRTGAEVRAEPGGRLGPRRGKPASPRPRKQRWTPEARAAQADWMRTLHEDPEFVAATVERMRAINQRRRQRKAQSAS